MSESNPEAALIALSALYTGLVMTYGGTTGKVWEAFFSWATSMSFTMSLSAHITASRVQALVESRGY